MNKLVLVIPVSALAAVSLAGCGSSSNSVSLASSGTLAEWRAAVACARQHGMTSVPDPVLGANGHPRIPGGTPTPTPEVRAACATQIQAIGGSIAGNPVESASDIRALVRVAACYRRHGFPRWPDPNTRGEFHVRSADAGTPATEARANAACNSLFPPSGWHLIVTPSGQ